MKKETIYSNYGIQYKAGKILSPSGEWIAPLLKKGNSKVGKAVFTYSQLPTNDLFDTKYGVVSGTCPCHCANCYACAGFYNMANVKDTLALNTIITRKNIDFKKAAIIAQIKADNITIVRIHAAGDFDSANDVNAWIDIINACPNTLFWTYTKRDFSEIENLNTFPNINIVPSIVCGRLNYGTCYELLELKKAVPSAYICPCGFDESTHCDSCKACATKKNVIFLLHSTPNYNAVNDPLYEILKREFEKQL